MLNFEEPILKTEKYEIECLPMDGEYFGFACAKVCIHASISESDLERILQAVSGYRFTTIINASNDIRNNQLMNMHGKFLYTDTNIQMSKQVTSNQCLTQVGLSISNNRAWDESLLQIADSALLHSRFFNDPNISLEKRAGFYRRWLSLSFNREDKYIISACSPDPLGFLLFRQAGDALAIELIGVLPEASGKGIGTAMVAALNAFAAERACPTLRTGTQLENIDALRFYEKNGFTIESYRSIYHYWQ